MIPYYSGPYLLLSALFLPFLACSSNNFTGNGIVTGFIDCLSPSPKILEPYPPDCQIALWMMTRDPYFKTRKNYAHITYKPSSRSQQPHVDRRTPLTWIHTSCKIVVDTEDPNLVDAWEVQSAWTRASQIFTHCIQDRAGLKDSVGGLAPLGHQGFKVLLRGRNVALANSK